MILRQLKINSKKDAKLIDPMQSALFCEWKEKLILFT